MTHTCGQRHLIDRHANKQCHIRKLLEPCHAAEKKTKKICGVSRNIFKWEVKGEKINKCSYNPQCTLWWTLHKSHLCCAGGDLLSVKWKNKTNISWDRKPLMMKFSQKQVNAERQKKSELGGNTLDNGRRRLKEVPLSTSPRHVIRQTHTRKQKSQHTTTHMHRDCKWNPSIHHNGDKTAHHIIDKMFCHFYTWL